MEKLFEYILVSAISYITNIPERRVYPDEKMLGSLAQFDEALAQNGCDPIETLHLLNEAGSSATVATTGGRYFGYVVGGSHPVSTAADWLVSVWDQVGLLPSTSPVVAKIEAVTARWLLDIFHLPKTSIVSFVTGASMGNLVCLAAARNHILTRLGWDVEANGLFGAPSIRVIVGMEAHITVVKTLGLLGMGRQRVEVVPVDAQGRLSIDALPSLDDRTIICLQAGNVNSGAFDPIAQVCARAKDVGSWVHIDGAFGLWAAASPDKVHLVKGIEQADSWVTDGHKWLNTPYDCGIAICRHNEPLQAAMTTTASYIANSKEIPAKDIVPEFSRRARAVPLWATMRSLGSNGITDLIDRCCKYALQFAEGLADLGFTIHNDVFINQVVASLDSPDKTMKFVGLLQEEGTCWLGLTLWQGHTAFRLSVSSWVTTEQDVDISLKAMAKILNEVKNTC